MQQQKKLLFLATMISLISMQTFPLEHEDFQIQDLEQAIERIGNPDQITENVGLVITCLQTLESCMSERIAKLCNDSINRLASSDFKVTDQHIAALKKLDQALGHLIDNEIPKFLSRIDISKLIAVVDKFKLAMVQNDEALKNISISCTAQFDPTAGTTPLEQLIDYARKNNHREFKVKIGPNGNEEFFMKLEFCSTGEFSSLHFNECISYQQSILMPTVNITDFTSDRNELPFATVRWIMSFAPIKINPDDHHPWLPAHTQRLSPSRIIETSYGKYFCNNYDSNAGVLSKHSISGACYLLPLNIFLQYQMDSRYKQRKLHGRTDHTAVVVTTAHSAQYDPSAKLTAFEQLVTHAFNTTVISGPKSKRVAYFIEIGTDPKKHPFVILDFDKNNKLKDIEFHPQQDYVKDPSISLPSPVDVTDSIKNRNELMFAAFNALRNSPKGTAQSLPEFQDLLKSVRYEDLSPAKSILIQGEHFVCRQKRSPWDKHISDDPTICSSVKSLLQEQNTRPKA